MVLGMVLGLDVRGSEEVVLCADGTVPSWR
jgi:hypothetical protein